MGPRLRSVEAFIADAIAAGPRPVKESAGYVLGAGGKRLRPALVLVVARALGVDGDQATRFAAVIEMIHTATLVHDDIIDHAMTRRGRETANHRWGDQLTVLLGDWLYTRATELAVEAGDIEIIRILSAAILQMTEGEILGLVEQGHAETSQAAYLDITRRKTGELFAAAAAIPACFSPRVAAFRQPLAAYGRSLGISFQIIDDLLDVTATASQLGKPVFSDLREGKLTLPFILLLPHLDLPDRALIERVLATRELGGGDEQHLRALLDRHGVITAARELAAVHGRQAADSLATLPSSPERDALELAPSFVLNREF